MENNTSVLDEIVESYEKIQNEFREKASALMTKAFESCFANHPEVKFVSWNQYIPYFNDGEPCEFGIGDIYITNAENVDDISAYGEYLGEDEEVFFTLVNARVSEKYRDFLNIVKFFNSEIGMMVAESAFGSDSHVVVSRDEVHIFEFEHD